MAIVVPEDLFLHKRVLHPATQSISYIHEILVDYQVPDDLCEIMKTHEKYL
jgi:hypothetical protein